METNFTKKYFILYWATFLELFKKNISWRSAVTEIVPAFIGLFIYIDQYGWNDIMNNFENFFWLVLSIPGTLAILYSAYILLKTPVDIYKKSELKFENLSWSNVEIDVFHFIYHGARIAALKVRNDKPIKIIELNAVIQDLWLDSEKIIEQKGLYWSNRERLHHMSTMDVLCPNGGEGIIPIAICTNKEAYLDDDYVTKTVNDIRTDSKRIKIERGKEYQINVVLYGKVESGATPKPLPSFNGVIIYEPPNIILKPAT